MASGSVPGIKPPMILGFSCVEWKSYNGSRFLRSLDQNCWWEALSGVLRWKFLSLQVFLNIRNLILFWPPALTCSLNSTKTYLFTLLVLSLWSKTESLPPRKSARLILGTNFQCTQSLTATPPVQPLKYAIRAHRIFSTCLTCSLIAAFGGLVGKQWLAHCTRLSHSSQTADVADEAEEATAPSSAPAVPIQQRIRTHRLARTQIPLATLFNFTWLDNGLDFYWKGAIRNLDMDAAANLSPRRQVSIWLTGQSVNWRFDPHRPDTLTDRSDRVKHNTDLKYPPEVNF